MSGISGSLDTLFGKMEAFISTKTVVGDPVHIGNAIIVPLVDVSFGVGAGANDGVEEGKPKKDTSMGGLGARITPSAVLVIVNDTVQLVDVKNRESVGRLVDMVPGLLSKLNIDKWLKNLFNKEKKCKEEDVVNELDPNPPADGPTEF